MRVSLDQLPAALGSRLSGAYLVSGDEPLLVGEAADAIRAAARAAGFADRRVFFIDRTFDWSELLDATRTLSLFSERRLFELRMPSGKPDKGAAQLTELALRPPPDIIIVVVTGKLDKKASEAPWLRTFEAKGVWVPIRRVDAAALPEWLRARAERARLKIDPAAAEMIADRVEGNLLAAKQELEKLALLAQDGRITRELVMQAVGDSARFDVYQLADAAGAGDAARALRILLGLKSEGVEPALILWALVRELRGLWQARERDRLRSNQRGGWSLASNPKPRALARAGKLPLARLFAEASRADRILKGLAAGEIWTALTGLTAALAGALQPTGVSGRVAQ